MNIEESSPSARSFGDTVRGYSVHLLTAAGIIPAFAAMAEIASTSCDPRLVFLYLFIATMIDAADGPLARRWRIKQTAPAIDGRTIDDLLDYLTFAFLPLALIWRMDWLPAGTGGLVVVGMAASLFGFAHTDAKREAEGFFRGFPSYWNIFAFYVGLLAPLVNAWSILAALLLLAIATVSPIWLLYPNLTPPPFRRWIVGGAYGWAILLLVLLAFYQDPPLWLTIVSLVYPVGYTLVSFWVKRQQTRTAASIDPSVE